MNSKLTCRGTGAFVSGHLDLTQEEFDEHYAQKISDALAAGDYIVVGDARGCDIMTQTYVASKGHVKALRVFHMFAHPRNIVDGAIIRGNMFFHR